MKKVWVLMLVGFCLVVLMMLGEPAQKSNVSQPESATAKLLSPGDLFEPGSYIAVDGVNILFDGQQFEIKNNREDIVRVTCQIVGLKNDGTYELLQMPQFGGVDEAQYEKDMQENGWAIEHLTNMIRPGETLVATMWVVDVSSFGGEYPSADFDGDGYYDIKFTISPQVSENSVRSSTSDPESEMYKLAAE